MKLLACTLLFLTACVHTINYSNTSEKTYLFSYWNYKLQQELYYLTNNHDDCMSLMQSVGERYLIVTKCQPIILENR